MSFELSKSFRFESAHRLAKGYCGKCANIHGHSWNGKLFVTMDKLNSMGMGIDYKDLKVITKEVEGLFDHKLLLQRDDQIIEMLMGSKTAIYTFIDNPTSEIIARFIYDYAKAKLQGLDPLNTGLIKNIKVEIEETCTSRCTYTE